MRVASADQVQGRSAVFSAPSVMVRKLSRHAPSASNRQVIVCTVLGRKVVMTPRHAPTSAPGCGEAGGGAGLSPPGLSGTPAVGIGSVAVGPHAVIIASPVPATAR